jgi:hypothetical protein
MMCHDVVNHPTIEQAGKKGKSSLANLQAELEANPLTKFSDEELQQVENIPLI